jgi:hypothetical protein
MNLPAVITKLVKAQNDFDSAAYADCFSESAIVVDEGKTYTGKTEIRKWIKKTNEEIKPVMKAVAYKELENENVLAAEFSGDFPGSPLAMDLYHTLVDGKIQALKIVG